MKDYLGSGQCACKRPHEAAIDEVIIGSGVIGRIPEILQSYNVKRPFVLSDANTYAAAGQTVCDSLSAAQIPFSQYRFPSHVNKALEPDEKAVGSAVMHFDNDCDFIIGVGSGVINDIGKIVSRISGRRYMIVATAPSMDGYASATSSMSMDGLKVSLNSKCADVIIGDTDILKNAPENMLKAGLGDMLAKYVSIAEWRISHLITGEYYCEAVAGLVRNALKKCVANADGLLKREEKAIEAVFEGLVISGVAMAYAGVSRPASGVEHYFSHIWDMRGLEFGTRVALHGIQCAVGTSVAVRLYEAVKAIRPDSDKALQYVHDFCYDDWCKTLRRFLGNSAGTMILQESAEQKYSKSAHMARYKRIEQNWDSILKILDEELPSSAELTHILDTIGISHKLSSLDIDAEAAKLTFKATKDVRDKYILSRLAWDLGILDDLAERI